MYQILALAKIEKIAMPESKGASPLQLLFPVLPLLPFFNKQKIIDCKDHHSHSGQLCSTVAGELFSRNILTPIIRDSSGSCCRTKKNG